MDTDAIEEAVTLISYVTDELATLRRRMTGVTGYATICGREARQELKRLADLLQLMAKE